MNYKLIDPVPNDAPPLVKKWPSKVDGKWVYYPIDCSWPYHNQTGAIRCYVTRCETPTGKVTPPMTLWDVDGKLKWKFKRLPEPLPLFNLNIIAHRPDAQIVVVEGEKCAEALSMAIPESNTKIVVSTWMGGAQNVYKAEWEPLRGRSVILWPDHDKPGRDAMLQVAGKLREMDCKIKILAIPEDKPDGWDVADGIGDRWDYPKIWLFIRDHLVDLPENLPAPPAQRKEPPAEPTPIQAADKPRAIASFQCLGYNRDDFFFLPDDTKQVTVLKAKDLTNASALCTLAGETYWRSMYSEGQRINWRLAGETVRHVAVSQGLYDPSKTRGRGGWIDAGRCVIHLGNRLIVDGVEKRLDEIQGEHRYELSGTLAERLVDELSNENAFALLKICEALPWDRDINGRFLAGWIVTAPVCGCLYWRPHIWVTGGAGTGKSWALTRIIKPCLGPFAVAAQSSTTEAGLRCKLETDARPVLFDEIEAEDQRSQSRVQHVLELARQASSDTDGKILKGTASQKVVEYQIRSQFLFSSIGVSATLQADCSRITTLELKRNPLETIEQSEAKFKDLEIAVDKIITPVFCAALRARTFSLMSVIRENARTFASAGVPFFKSRRVADQHGALLAGAFSLTSKKLITFDAATEWLRQRSWDIEAATMDSNSDSTACLGHILQYTFRVGSKDVSVARCLWSVKTGTDELSRAEHGGNLVDESDVLFAEVEHALGQLGISINSDQKSGDLLAIASSTRNPHSGLKKILSATPWAKDWGRQLTRIPGAMQKSVRILGGKTWCVVIPWSQAFPD